MMKNTNARCYRIVLYKRFFDCGFGLLSYLKYFLLIIGIGEVVVFRSVWKTLVIGGVYAIFCFFLGRHWHKYGYERMAQKVNNFYNPEITEILKILKKR